MPPETRFDRDTAVTLREPGIYAAHIDKGWWIVNGPNGGYVAAIILRALLAEVNDPARSPRSLTIHYLRPPVEGPAEVRTVTERAGRTLSTVSARLVQGGKLMAIAVGAFATAREGFVFADREMPALPPPEQCQRLLDKYPNAVALQHRYDSRWGVGAELGSGASKAIIGGWIRFGEPRLIDALAVAAFTDSSIPAAFTRVTADQALGALPTVNLTIHFRATLPLATATIHDFSAAVFTSTFAREGFVEEDGEVWSPDGILLAQSRQLAIVT